LRAAAIASSQRNAGSSYAVRDDGGELRASAQGFGVRYDADGSHFGAGDEVHGSLVLTGVGCEGALAPVSPAQPSYVSNRVMYARQALGVSVEEWYLTGPMGLEQGFTLSEPPSCVANGAKLVLEVAAEGLEVRADDGALTLEAASGERFRYSDLFAKDATGAALPAQMERTAEGHIALIVDATKASFPIEVDPLVWAQHQKLLAADGAANDAFAGRLALSGGTALVGATNGAYVFERSGTVWLQQQKLSGNGVLSVALAGDTALMGASGGAYVFVRSGTTWTTEATLLPSDGMSFHYGWSVALSGDTALVGAYYDDDNGTGSGSAYVFVRSGTSWSQQAKLLASDGAADDNFGMAVALGGDTAIVGAPFDDDKGTSSGSAYAFTRSGTVWSQHQKLLASDGKSYDVFGDELAMSSDTALVGAGSAVYVQVRSGTSWSQQAKLTAANGTAPLGPVALGADTALVGAFADDHYGPFTGVAYLFERSGTSWSEKQKLAASDGASYDYFGFSVALSADTVLVGAYQDDDKGSGSGSAYVFALKESNGEACSVASDCASGFCVDGVCCDKACSGGTNDCQACSVATGAPTNGTCGVIADSTPCDDSDACTQTDTCQSGTCTGGSPVTCTAQDECHDVGTCNPSTGACSNPAKNDGTTCSTGTCQGGSCQASGTGGAAGNGGGGGASTGGAAGATTGGTSSGGSPTGGASGNAGSATGGTGASSSSGDESGCGCRTAGRERDASAAWLLLALGIAAARRRREGAVTTASRTSGPACSVPRSRSA